MLEMQADKNIYVDSIMSYEAILCSMDSISDDQESLDEFLDTLKQVNQRETFLENSFNEPN